MIKNAFVNLDRVIVKCFKTTSEREEKYYAIRKNVEDRKDVLYDMDVIDSKSTALLTHISIMFVVVGLFLSKENHLVIQGALLLEMVSYLIIAMFLLRCIDIMGPPFRTLPEVQEEATKVYYTEVTLRREIYHRTLRLVYLLTAALIPIVIFKYIL